MLKIFVLIVGVFCSYGQSFALEQQHTHIVAAVSLVEKVTKDVLGSLKENKQQLKTQPSIVYGIVEKTVLPFVSFEEMSIWLAGKNIWGHASSASKERFIRAFRLLTLRTYAKALNKYTNETVTVFAPKETDNTLKRIQVQAKISSSQGEPISIFFRLFRAEEKWYFYDMIVEGVSILDGFRTQFSQKIRQQGLDAVTLEIEQHNQQYAKE
jgi:phospholipid transport system substrate-binding protein